MPSSIAPTPLHIAIDGNEANVANRVGSNVYAYQLLRALQQLTEQRQIKVTVLLADPPLADLPTATKTWQYQVIGPHPMWTQIALPWHLWQNRYLYQVFFTPGHYAPRVAAVPYVSSVMDIGYLHYPDQFRAHDRVQLSQWTKYSVQHANKVIAISEFTKQEVSAHYGRHPSDIVVAYPAVEAPLDLPPSTVQRQVLKKYGIRQPYLLYVGTLQPRKNLERLIEAFELVQDKALAAVKPPFQDQRSRRWYQARIQLVIAGKVGWLADSILERIKASPYADDIVVTGYIDDQTKQVLYRSAACQVLVGLYEGFGIPPLEAMQLGIIPVVANGSSLPEVVGKAGIKVNPEQPSAIAAGLWKALTLSPAQRSLQQRAAIAQSKKFSWHSSAEKVLAVLEQVAAAGK